MLPADRTAVYDREFLRPGQRPWIPDPSDLEHDDDQDDDDQEGA